MIDEKNISLPDLLSGKLKQTLTLSGWPSVLCLVSGSHPLPEEYQRATLIVASDTEQVTYLLSENILPELTPILFLADSDKIPETIIDQGKNRLIDYLDVPVSLEVFLHRISFLTRVQKISAEHHANTTTLSQQLNLLYSRDGLTGLFNRRHLTNHLMETLQRARSNGEELSLLMLNIDYFNNVNKSTGLEFGDFILNEIAARLTETTSDTESCYRFSGEDFVVMLPSADLNHALETAKRVSKTCCGKPFTDGIHSIFITISVGIASLQEHRPDNHDKFIFMAESALFVAKAEGRNRIQIYIPQNEQEKDSPQSPLVFLKKKLSRILEKTRTSAISSLQLLAKNVAGPEHKNHVASVSHYANLLGEQLGLPKQHIHTFQNSITLYNSFRALLHNDLLRKPGRLTRDERKTMEDLPFKLTELTDMFDYFSEERSVLLSLSERYDGTGHPLGLKGNEIPLGARIFNIVDSLAAMNSERPYRRRLTPEEIIEELKKEAGKQFDPFLVLQILILIKNNHLLNVDPAMLDRTQQELINIFSEFKQ
jgi:diguanylate cyclase (GGDEF)-like protein